MAEGRGAVVQDESYGWSVGIDWATQTHEVCVLDGEGHRVAERSVLHAGSAIAEFVDWLVNLAGGQPDHLSVAIERFRGALWWKPSWSEAARCTR